MFDKDDQNSCMLSANPRARSEHVRNRINGIGGRIPLGAGIRSAAAMHLKEKVDIEVEPTDLSIFHTIRYPNGRSTYMLTGSAVIAKPNWYLFNLKNLDFSSCVFDLEYLIPMAQVFRKYPHLRSLGA